MSAKQILIALGITFAAAAVTIAVNLFMAAGTTPMVLLDQRSDLSIPSEPQIPDDNSATENDSTAVDSAIDGPS